MLSYRLFLYPWRGPSLVVKPDTLLLGPSPSVGDGSLVLTNSDGDCVIREKRGGTHGAGHTYSCAFLGL